MTYCLDGRSFIGFGRGEANPNEFCAFNPRNGEEIGPAFYSATPDELEQAVALADGVRIAYSKVPGAAKAKFLRTIAVNIELLGHDLIERLSLETALPSSRLESERLRTCNQLRMFAQVVTEGSWVDARIDFADPTRRPVSRPDLRSMLRPIGTAAVFCASNVPLAYSVAGGDVASALAAGCAVVVNANPAHPGGAEMVAGAVVDAAKSSGMPEGVFNLLFSKGYDNGQALVRHPLIKAVGFTGSRTGGRALMDIAAARPEPIPVYAEMSSVNPTFILPRALAERAEILADELHQNVTYSAGQFCTKPGIVLLSDVRESGDLSSKLSELISLTPSPALLTAGIADSYRRNTSERAGDSSGRNGSAGYEVEPAIFQATAEVFLSDPKLSEEIFGPVTQLVIADKKLQLLDIARRLEGQLTASVHGTPEDLAEFAELIDILETKAGRVVINGFSNGVEVNDSIVHGGPYPATSDSRSTSVGTRAITRFARLVCYQNFPQESLPQELRDENPLNIERLLNGERTRAVVRKRQDTLRP
jgi:NADP-dependent aldehyde dehydrogenase